MREYWTELDGTNGLYDISNFGNVRSARTRKNLSPQIKKGVVVVCIRNKKVSNTQKKYFLAHEVYKHFTDKLFIYNGFKVFHIDGNKRNCSFNNLAVLEHIHNKATSEQLKVFEAEVYKNVRMIVYGSYKYARGLDLEELVQESVVLIYKYLPNFTQEKSFKSFCSHYVKMVFNAMWEKIKNDRSFYDWELGRRF